MKTTDTTIGRTGEAIGTVMWIFWLVFLGPIGFLLLLGVAYAMVVQNLALGIICSFLLVSPFMLTAVWAPVTWFTVLQEHRLALGSERLAHESVVSR